jgi:hypothetical protein
MFSLLDTKSVLSPIPPAGLNNQTQAILRCLYAYFRDLSQEDLPYIKIPLHTVIKLTPKAYGCDEERCVCFACVSFYPFHKDFD